MRYAEHAAAFVDAARLGRYALFSGQAGTCNRELSNLLDGDEHHAAHFFVRWVVDTVASLGPGRVPLWGRMATGSALCPARSIRPDRTASSRLRLGWLEWEVLWDFLVDRHPRLALADLLSDAGETIARQVWPYGCELELLDWADRGTRLPLPWPAGDPDRAWSENDYQLLRDVRRDAGGWVFHDGATRRRAFRSDAEVQATRAGTAR